VRTASPKPAGTAPEDGDGRAGLGARVRGRGYAAAHGVDAARPAPSLERLLGIPVTGGNRITVLCSGDEIFPAMLAWIRAA